jgi:hypothetical protein
MFVTLKTAYAYRLFVLFEEVNISVPGTGGSTVVKHLKCHLNESCEITQDSVNRLCF